MSCVSNNEVVRANPYIDTLMDRLQEPLERAWRIIQKERPEWLRGGEKTGLDTITMIFFREIAYAITRADYDLLLNDSREEIKEKARQIGSLEDWACLFVRNNPRNLLAGTFREELQARINDCNIHFDSGKKYAAVDKLLCRFYSEKRADYSDEKMSYFSFVVANELACSTRYGETFRSLINSGAVTVPQTMWEACGEKVGHFDPRLG